MSEEKRLLPSDFNRLRKEKYDSLDNVEKKVASSSGFFVLPSTVKGVQKINQMEFLVFYFQDSKKYETVKDFFEIKTSNYKVHPIMDSDKLYNLIIHQINESDQSESNNK